MGYSGWTRAPNSGGEERRKWKITKTTTSLIPSPVHYQDECVLTFAPMRYSCLGRGPPPTTSARYGDERIASQQQSGSEHCTFARQIRSNWITMKGTNLVIRMPLH